MTPKALDPRARITLRWECGVDASHDHATFESAQACIRERQQQHRADPYELEQAAARTAAAIAAADGLHEDVRYRVHLTAGALFDSLKNRYAQHCANCGAVLASINGDDVVAGRVSLVDAFFPVGRRVVQGPACISLVTPDRQLAPDEVPCV